MIRIHDCVTWNAFSNLWNCINSLDFCHHHLLLLPNVPCSILFIIISKYPKQVQNLEQIFFFLEFILVFFSQWNVERKRDNEKQKINGLMNLKLVRSDIDLFENESHFMVEIKIKSFAESRWKIQIRNTPFGYVCTNNDWYYGQTEFDRSFSPFYGLEFSAAIQHIIQINFNSNQ